MYAVELGICFSNMAFFLYVVEGKNVSSLRPDLTKQNSGVKAGQSIKNAGGLIIINAFKIRIT